jgi:hypothetical protein
MTMKKNLFLLTILLTTVFNLNVNKTFGIGFTKVTSTSQFVDGGLYFITSSSGSDSYYFSFNGNDVRSYNNSYQGVSSRVATETAISHSNILKFIRKGLGDWQLYDIKLHKYLGISDIGIKNYLSVYDAPQDEYKIGFYPIDKKNNSFDIGLLTTGNTIYNLALNVNDYDWYSSSNTSVQKLTIYQITDYSTTLDETQDLPTTTGTINVSLNISFSNNYYNTLMLPCKITGSYSAVFGTGVKAYSVKSSESDGITFTLVPDADGLQANTPYLIKGTFFNPPFIISNTTIDASGASNGINTVTTGGSTFNGIYKTGIDLGGNKYYVLYNDNFYSCESYKTMPIKLFRWYLSSSASPTKKLIIRDETTGINVPVSIAKEPTDNRIYRLDGTYAGTSFDALSKGIYISHGKKIIK